MVFLFLFLVVPKKLGIRLCPPALMLVYEQSETEGADAGMKLRLRTIPLRNLVTNITSTDFLLEDLRARHDMLAGIPDHKIIRMVEIIKKVRSGKGSLEEIIQENGRTVSEKPSKQSAMHVTNEKSGGKSSKNKIEEEKQDEEDTDFEIDDELPLDKLESEEEDDFWNL
ncbi:uncharacterized protein isoform X2 [Rhodnius prolixus]|uniref:uncharacterized protein isoform X2 n=1 Tax=Rhodnius prolixus TaxID=13249 RepID=UPI003D18BABD